MDKYINLLSQNLLFKNLGQSEINAALQHLKPKITRHYRGEYICMAGNEVNELYILLEGSVQVIYEDDLGRRVLMAQYAPGDTIMELFVGSDFKLSFFVTLAATDCVLAAISFEQVRNLPLPDKIWNTILKNVWSLSAKKKIMLYRHLLCVSRPGIREKLISYLKEQKDKTGKSDFIIPLNKKELAEYLFINRQAMMKELAAMKKDKIIDFKGLHFTLKTENP